MRTPTILMIAIATFAGCSSDEGAKQDQLLPSLQVVRGAELQDFVSSCDTPVLVEFGVDYQCERCRQMKGGVEELADKFSGKAEVVRVDFNSNAPLVAQFGGTICPTYVFFQDGQPVRTESFPVSADILESQLTDLTQSSPFAPRGDAL